MVEMLLELLYVILEFFNWLLSVPSLPRRWRNVESED